MLDPTVHESTERMKAFHVISLKARLKLVQVLYKNYKIFKLFMSWSIFICPSSSLFLCPQCDSGANKLKLRYQKEHPCRDPLGKNQFHTEPIS